MTMQSWTTTTPVGPLSIITDNGVVIASGFRELSDTRSRLADQASAIAPATRIDGVSDAVVAYFAGDVSALDDVPVAQPGGPFQQQAWIAMRGIAAGQVWSYSELATKAGRPSAVRAAASACARNMVAPFVPCHRVVRSDGSLGGYYYGLDVKQWLLDHERG
jgi:methylated-DNA-[protein]-cysteine S-methyltransferase